MDIRNILTESLGLSYKETGGVELLISCPNPRHEDRSPSCHINSETGLFHCKGCQFSGNIKRLIRLILKSEADPLLDSLNLTSASLGPLEKILKDLRTAPKPECRPTNDLTKFNALKTQFFNESRFSVDRASEKWFYFKGGTLIEDHDIRHWLTPDTYYNRMCIPMRSLNGEISNFIWRALEDTQKPKYLMLSHDECLMDKKAFIFPNLNVINGIKPLPYVVLVEGPFDAIYLDSIGIPSIAVLGTNITGEQIELINPITNKIFLLFDGDDAGHQASISNYYKLNKLLDNIQVLYPYNYQKELNKTINPSFNSEIKNPWQVDKKLILKLLHR